MAWILHIDTALSRAIVGLSKDGQPVTELFNERQHDHAAFVQPAVQQVLEKAGIALHDLAAVGVTAGPGSYTGLRVGMASAKGICYALDIPLLTASTLEVMAAAAITYVPGYDVYCPMIDARRSEVYTAQYDIGGREIQKPQALILAGNSFEQELIRGKVLFTGNGAVKWKEMINPSANAFFEQADYNGAQLAANFLNSFKNKEFCDLAYTDPLYLKDFHFTTNKNKA
ncbi:MAG: tRNA (adenosine(37)-N6)-threonylcarbamoyltransferase complex dimerization subunit type 1 TsaB [Chitinophagaceae bacterium]|nr:tRNA (adenosine(37)-N6)-threonylcarbamoyltransferase complex dimerization subunit type 1 TsaB [Chitinophagaceae bacterium]